MARIVGWEAIDERFEQILGELDVRAVLRLAVRPSLQVVVGVEALDRGSDGSALAPAESFATANRAVQLTEFDWAARASTCRAALAAGPGVRYVLLLDSEPVVVDSECRRDFWVDIERALRTFALLLEVSSCSLDRDSGMRLFALELES